MLVLALLSRKDITSFDNGYYNFASVGIFVATLMQMAPYFIYKFVQIIHIRIQRKYKSQIYH